MTSIYFCLSITLVYLGWMIGLSNVRKRKKSKMAMSGLSRETCKHTSNADGVCPGWELVTAVD